DSSIIVTDNIGQYKNKGFNLDKSCIKGTNEVIAPMLSSVLTTISVFVPLIFLSGIGGAIFFDQAFSVTIGLLISYITGIIFLPVLYKTIYTIKCPKFIRWKYHKIASRQEDEPSVAERIYNKGINWIFTHKVLTAVVILATFPICVYLFFIIKKEKMPDIKQNELIVNIEWNENVHLYENHDRCFTFFKEV